MNHSEAGAYAPRSFASFIDTLPSEPSIGVFNYFTYYNGSGNASRQFPIAEQIALNVDAISYADSIGALWVTPLKIILAVLCTSSGGKVLACSAALATARLKPVANSSIWSQEYGVQVRTEGPADALRAGGGCSGDGTTSPRPNSSG